MLSQQEDSRTPLAIPASGERKAGDPLAGAGAHARAEDAAATTDASTEPSTSMRERVFFAACFAVLEDGLVASSTTFRAHAGVGQALVSGLEAAAFLAFPVALLAVPLAFLLNRPGSRVLGRHLRVGLSGERSEYEGVGISLFAIAVCAGAGLAWAAGLRVSEGQSARVATLVALAGGLLFAAVGAMLVANVVGLVGPLVKKAESAIAPPAWIPVEEIAVATVGVVTLYLLLPASHAITPAAALVGFAVGPNLASRVPTMQRAARFPVAALLGATLVTCAASSVALKHLPDSVQIGLLARAPYASIAITTLRRVVDRDHDGYSPILGGGDCNDADPAVHPGAVDIADNKIDENCSGTDAHLYTPAIQAAPRDPKAPAMRENVILIHMDALRPDHVGFVGYKRPTTPHIDRFREGATWFKNAYTPVPSTRFALSEIFTGLSIEQVPQSRGHAVDFTLLPEAVTLAERLEGKGYDRVGYTLSYVLQHIKEIGQGFRVWQTPWPVDDWKASYEDSAKQTTDAALKYIKGVPEDGSKPYLLFLHYECTHDPYIKHRAWDYGDRDIDKYDSALNYCDDQLGALFDALDARADKEKTAIFLYSDHGELFGEHGYTKHGNTLYQPDVRVLLLAKVPGDHVSEIDTPMSLSDMTPTIFELTGLPADPASQTWNLLPYLLRGQQMPDRRLFLYSDLWRNGVHFESRGVLDLGGNVKFIRNVSAGMNELYDLTKDPDELSNIADARPSDRDKLAELVDGWESYENKDGKSFETVNKEKEKAR